MEQAIQEVYAQSSVRSIGGAQEALRERYRNDIASAFKDDRERLVYLLARMPLTSLVLEGLLQSLSHVLPTVMSVRDFGAGPATLLWAIYPRLWPLDRIDLIERDLGIKALGNSLLKHYPSETLKSSVQWYSSLEQSMDNPVDLTVSSYSLGEVKAEERSRYVEKLFHQTKEAFVVIEPGSPQGFSVIRDVREQLISLGAYILSPCPHQKTCPMPSNDWCHFKMNCVRPKFLQQAKQSRLGYEEESYSYLIALKKPFVCTGSRIVRSPLKRSGHVSLDLCTPNGLKRMTMSKKDGAFYKIARKSEWGDMIDVKGFSEKSDT